MERRQLLSWLASSVAVSALGPALGGCTKADARDYPVRYTEAEWRRRLTAEQFAILRQKGTEVPGTSPLLREHRRGTFVCAADGHPLFASSTKYDSRTGWPSFSQALTGAVRTATDYEVGYARTEVLCARCGGHLGHVFDDGPRPTGKRYCMNGDAMLFRPAT